MLHHLHQFQFHKVRLKAFTDEDVESIRPQFQFHKVRLKVDFDEMLRQFDEYFNSKRFD